MNLNSRDQLLSHNKGRSSMGGNASPHGQVSPTFTLPLLSIRLRSLTAMLYCPTGLLTTVTMDWRSTLTSALRPCRGGRRRRAGLRGSTCMTLQLRQASQPSGATAMAPW